MNKIMALCAAALFVFVSTSAQARSHHHHHRHNVASAGSFHIDCDHQGCHKVFASRQHREMARYVEITRPEPSRRVYDGNDNRAQYAEQVIPHPAGCAWRAFCGCGASVEIFGHPVRELYLAANWRKFPSASPAPGMAAWRNGHVFIIRSVNGDGTVVAIDHNSGGHLSRIHTVSLRGMHVVNPRGAMQHAAYQPNTRVSWQ